MRVVVIMDVVVVMVVVVMMVVSDAEVDVIGLACQPTEEGKALLPALDREPDGPRGVKQVQVLIAGLFQRATGKGATRLTRYHLQRRGEATSASIRRRCLMDSSCPCARRKKHKSVLASLLFVGNPHA